MYAHLQAPFLTSPHLNEQKRCLGILENEATTFMPLPSSPCHGSQPDAEACLKELLGLCFGEGVHVDDAILLNHDRAA